MDARSGDTVLAILFAFLGVVVGIVGFAVLNDGPNAAVLVVVTIPDNHAIESTLGVTFFGLGGYSRSAANASAFDVEVAFWTWAPPTTFALVGGMIGGYIGYRFGRKRHNSIRSQDAEQRAAADGGAK